MNTDAEDICLASIALAKTTNMLIYSILRGGWG